MTPEQLGNLINAFEGEQLGNQGGGFGLRFKIPSISDQLYFSVSINQTNGPTNDEDGQQEKTQLSSFSLGQVKFENHQILKNLDVGEIGENGENVLLLANSEELVFSRINNRKSISLEKAASVFNGLQNTYEAGYQDGALRLVPKSEKEPTLRGVLTDLIQVRFLDWCTGNKNLPKIADRLSEEIKGPLEALETKPADEVSFQFHGEFWNNQSIRFGENLVKDCLNLLRSGKNLILTGPPGYGKTQLAKLLAEANGINNPSVQTASPAWTTDELIGRYLPRRDGKGLRFSPGYFLSSIEKNPDSILIVDEINRCDLDSCFGELFSVLSGITTTLPFKDVVEDEEEADIVVGPASPSSEDDDSIKKRTFFYGENFRIIGTMNTRDAGRLHEFSEALLRRFAFVDVSVAQGGDQCPEALCKALAQQIQVNGNKTAAQVLIHSGNLTGNTPLRNIIHWFYPLHTANPEQVSPATLIDLGRLFFVSEGDPQLINGNGAGAMNADSAGFERSKQTTAETLQQTARLLLSHWKSRLEPENWSALVDSIDNLTI